MIYVFLDQWLPVYMKIVDDFGYSVEDDMYSAMELARLRGSDVLEPLKSLRGKSVEVLGPYADTPTEKEQIVADSALERALKVGSVPKYLVTDLDGNVALQRDLNLDGVTAIMHAHGDNIEKIVHWAPRFKGHVIATCQCEPPEGIYNFGGFTDGDRGVVLADHFGAKEIILNGWDFKNPVEGSSPTKAKKLRWAREIIDMLDTPITIL